MRTARMSDVAAAYADLTGDYSFRYQSESDPWQEANEAINRVAERLASERKCRKAKRAARRQRRCER